MAPQAGFWGFLVVILLTSPLQAAAEEIFFRGYLMQALGSLVARPWFGVVVVRAGLRPDARHAEPGRCSSTGSPSGCWPAVLVWRTGGLEAGIAAHVVNNIFAYVIAGLTTLDRRAPGPISAIGWLDAGFEVGGFAVFAVLALLVARRVKLRNRWTCRSAADVAGPAARLGRTGPIQ